MHPLGLDLASILDRTFVADVDHHAVLASTNDCAARRAAERFDRLPLLVVADRQTAGRGRGTNRWWTGEGSLAFSLLVTSVQVGVASRQHSPLVALATAVGVIDGLKALLPDLPLGLHWPNDIMAGDGKLAGILVEVLSSGHYVVGIGINTNNSAAQAPPEIRPLVATLSDLTGQRYDPTTILISVLNRLADCFRQLTSNPSAVAARADSLCSQKGRMLTIQQGGRLLTGRCCGIADDGALMLETAGKAERIYSGVVRR